jgi:CubicO group peptidase (beta-lactamase class C family)
MGSVSKVFTALGVLKYLEEDRITLEDPVSAYFPGYPEGERLSLCQLLQHTSGVAEVTKIPAWSADPARDWTPQEALALFSKEPLEFEPGQRAQYSNSPFIILGLLLERLSGRSYERFVQEELAAPLGMTTLRLGSQRDIMPHRARGYALEGGRLINAPPESPVSAYASGGLMATAEDLAKLGKAFLPGVLLSEQTIAAMISPAELSDGSVFSIPLEDGEATFGMGLEVFTWHGQVVPTKNGAISGYSALFLAHPSSKTAVAVLTNLSDSGRAAQRIARKAAALVSSGALPE